MNIDINCVINFNNDVITDGMNVLLSDEKTKQCCGELYSNKVINPIDICNREIRTIPINITSPETKMLMNAYNLLWRKYVKKCEELGNVIEEGQNLVKRIEHYNYSGKMHRMFNSISLNNIYSRFKY